MGHAKPEYDPVSLSPLSFWSGTPRQRDESLRILPRRAAGQLAPRLRFDDAVG